MVESALRLRHQRRAPRGTARHAGRASRALPRHRSHRRRAARPSPMVGAPRRVCHGHIGHPHPRTTAAEPARHVIRHATCVDRSRHDRRPGGGADPSPLVAPHRSGCDEVAPGPADAPAGRHLRRRTTSRGRAGRDRGCCPRPPGRRPGLRGRPVVGCPAPAIAPSASPHARAVHQIQLPHRPCVLSLDGAQPCRAAHCAAAVRYGSTACPEDSNPAPSPTPCRWRWSMPAAMTATL